MPITFQICIDYNQVFYRNLNKLATCLPMYYLVACGAFWPSLVMGSCKTEQIDRLTYRLFF
jgi:hypothetical protein